MAQLGRGPAPISRKLRPPSVSAGSIGETARKSWEKTYRRGTSVKEKAFHDELHKRLLADPELGGRVERGDPLALGYLDTRHDGITAELKVERRVPVTKASVPKDLGQPRQYAAADGARLSILAILDMSPKALLVGIPENYMFTLEPRLHGLTNPEAPSLTAVLIVNGNMPSSRGCRAGMQETSNAPFVAGDPKGGGTLCLILGGRTLAVPGAAGCVALAQRAVIGFERKLRRFCALAFGVPDFAGTPRPSAKHHGTRSVKDHPSQGAASGGPLTGDARQSSAR